VKNAEEAIDLSEKIKSDEQILLLVWSSNGRSGGTRYLVVEPEKAGKSKKEREEE
jgi:hypothetical protein